MNIKVRVEYIVIMVESEEIELQGHIIDSGIMTRLFDRIMDMGGNFEILVFEVGKKKTDPSYCRLKIIAHDKEKLRSILSELHRLGARLPPVQSVHYEPATDNQNAPGVSIQPPTTRPRSGFLMNGSRWMTLRWIF
jgi:hypothetical protein